MRLICPNCSAQYEVDGSMIPDEGRDVQCSNCGHTWFELPGPRDTDGDIAASGEFGAASTDGDDAFDIEDNPEQDAEDAELTKAADDAPEASDGESDDNEDEDDFDTFEETPQTSRRETRPENLSRQEFFDDDDTSDPSTDLAADDGEEETPLDTFEHDDEGDEEDDRDATSEAIRAVTAAAASVDDDDSSANEAPAGRKRAPADIAALDILREEAERELSQRRATPSDTIETQTDLGLDDIRNRRTPSRALRARMAHLGEEMPEPEEPETPQPAPVSEPISRPVPEEDDGYEEPRRDLLPDIEEINSTLSSSAAGAADVEARNRSGFRVGFLLMLFLVVAIIFAYAQAPAIARALPETEPSLIAFVDWANGVRDQIDGLIGN